MATDIAMALWPLYFVLALGFFAGKHRSFTADAAKELNKLAMTFALPAALFVSTATLSAKTLIQDLPALAVVVISYLGMFLLALGILHFFFKRSLPESALGGLCSASPAGPFFGPAVLLPLFGSGGMIAVTLVALVLNIVQNPVALGFLGGAGEKIPAKPVKKTKLLALSDAVASMVSLPIVWAPLLGLAFALFGIPLSKVLTAGFQLIGTASSGIAIFAIGLTLSASGFQITKEIIVAALIKMIALPTVVLGIGLLFGIRGNLLSECIIVSALSSGVLGMMLSSTREIYIKESASITILTSVSMIVFLPLWIFITKLIAT